MMNYEILSWSTFKFWELSYFKEIYANLAYVAGVSKNLREGSETAQEGDYRMICWVLTTKTILAAS